MLAEPPLQQAFLAEAGREISLAVLSRPHVAWNLAEELCTRAPTSAGSSTTRLVYFPRLERQAALAEFEGRTEMAESLRRKAFVARERGLGLVRSCDATLVVFKVEQELLDGLVDDADVCVLSHVHEVGGDAAKLEGRADVLFVGNFDHQSNIDALLAPLRFGAGAEGEIGESLGAGVPVVGTRMALENMPLKPDGEVVVADDARSLANGVMRLLTDYAEWERLSSAGKITAAALFGPDVFRVTLRGLLRPDRWEPGRWRSRSAEPDS